MSNITNRPIIGKAGTQEKRTRFAWVICPHPRCGPSCELCNGAAKLKVELIRVAQGSGSKGGAKAPKRNAADAKHSKAVRERDGWRCTRCGKDFSVNHGGLQAAHYVKRRYKALRKGYSAHTGDGCCLRHSIDNAAALCISCHIRLEGNSAEHEEHFRSLWGDSWCDGLRAESQKRPAKRVKRSF